MGIFDKKRIIVVCFFVFFCQMIFPNLRSLEDIRKRMQIFFPDFPALRKVMEMFPFIGGMVIV